MPHLAASILVRETTRGNKLQENECFFPFKKQIFFSGKTEISRLPHEFFFCVNKSWSSKPVL